MLPIQVLLVEDNPGDARLVRELLGEEEGRFVVDHAGSLGAACELLSAGTSDVVLLDLSLPDSQGFGTISSIRARASHLPLIVLTGFDDADFAVEAVKAGTLAATIDQQAGRQGYLGVVYANRMLSREEVPLETMVEVRVVTGRPERP